MGSCEDRTELLLREVDLSSIEPTLKFLTEEQKQRLYVLDKLLTLRRQTKKFVNYDYCYITILKFLQVPREIIYDFYSNCSIRRVANAYRERSPLLKQFDYTLLGINSEEWLNFQCSCYEIIGDVTKWRQ